ncbi:lysine decarboxylase LdcC [Ignatzschineria cameli]|uniref:Lysine decarboxylase LdcC n=2 Tax=Bacteria TaxID=2 RepID=A0A2U2ARS1_9GAMM|nr:lysine decarboxylase LdcC [Ignatzschineria cameli]PWD86719.1 lysine decarboxylase LdcC [Ignatzschineria cameli]PWD86928.1 lysine decarboxylase LdcC [Ignatzschineria cameli]PWD91900.1 lysine decarboxylase LdcC [Ignatzschineria cameli]PWD93513.1 lysine decarboxylase LdcC [Ignatzschineria cameli]PWD94255.1 lysine decarboxylase LdcC [Ignatzschineria cameli]
MYQIALLNDVREEFKSLLFSQLETSLREMGYRLLLVERAEDLLNLLEKNPRVSGVIFDWDNHELPLCQQIAHLNEQLPLFTFINDKVAMDLSLADLKNNLYFYDYVLNNAEDSAVRIDQRVEEYIEQILPPFTKALFKYVGAEKYTFCTPGHMGGTAFEQSPVGSLFYDFYGENTFRSDISISMGELGSLLDHSGPHREAEEYIAETFSADRSFIITNGTSTANKVVGMYACPEGSTIIVDRNCHKSITHLMMMTNVKPIYLKPTRNAYGILGGIPKKEFEKAHIEQLVAEREGGTAPVHAIITNSTYDGLFYDTDYIKQNLPVNSIHFDSAWVPYTNFHPIYEGKSGMGGERVEGKVIYETQSTHKLLAAFSQASMIHVKGEINERTFNEGYMMHTTTSPLYSIVASCEVSAAMMRGQAGRNLMTQAINRAIDFRKEIARLNRESSDWFFDVWQPENIDEVACWPLNREDRWHGFNEIDDNFLYLDPIKITLTTPGMDASGKLDEWGIPASIVSQFLDEHGIVVEKTGPYSLLFLFSMGIDETKAMTLLRTLMKFKHAYDQNLKIKEAMPALYAIDPQFYAEMHLQELAQGIHHLMKVHQLPQLMYNAFDSLPEMEMTPHEAYQAELRGKVTECKLSELMNQVSANMILPYPPGVPLIMPGEKVTEETKPILEFLEMLCDIGSHYPGFETDIHGVYQNSDGEYVVRILDL